MTQYYPPNTKMFDNRPIHRRDPLLLDVVGRLQKEGVYEDNLRNTNFGSEKPRNGLGLTEPLGAAPGPIANVIPMPEQEPAYDTTIERPDVPPPYNPNYPVTIGPRPTTQVHPGIVASVSDTTANVTLIEDGSVVTASLLLPNEKVSSDCLPALAEDDSVSVLETPDGYWYVLQGFIEKADILSYIAGQGDTVSLGTTLAIDGSNIRMARKSVTVLSDNGAGTNQDITDEDMFDLLANLCVTTDIVSDVTSLTSDSDNLTLAYKKRTGVTVFVRENLPTDTAANAQEALATVAVGTDIDLTGTTLSLDTQTVYVIGAGDTGKSTGITGTEC